MRPEAKVLLRSWPERLLLVFLLLKLFLIIPVMRNPDAVVTVDSTEYLGMMNRIAESSEYLDPVNPERDLVRPPGYPVILYLIQGTLGSDVYLISLVQLAVQGLTAWAILWIGKLMDKGKAGLVGAWLYATSPNATVWSMTVMTETWLAFLIVVALLMLISALRSGVDRWPISAGALLGISSYIRPIAIILMPVWAGLTMFMQRGAERKPRWLYSALALMLSTAVVMAPWVLRNQIVKDRFVFSTVGEKTWVGFNLAEIVAVGKGIDRNTAVGQIDTEHGLLVASWDVLQAHPVASVRVIGLGVARTVMGTSLGTWGEVLGFDDWQGLGLMSGFFTGGPGPAVEELREEWFDADVPARLGLFVLSLGHTMLLFGLAVVSIATYHSQPEEDRAVLLFCLATSVVLILSPVAAGQARFRVPAEPLLALAAGYGWAVLRRYRSTAFRSPLKVGASAVHMS